jgi:diguanylate cyclase (GGDEF)-like protein
VDLPEPHGETHSKTIAVADKYVLETVIGKQAQIVVASPGGQALLPVMKILLEGISTHSIRINPEEHKQFTEKLYAALEQIDDEATVSESVHQAKAVVHAIREYNARTTRRIHQCQSEQGAILLALLETFEDLRIASPDKMRQLKEICGKLAKQTDAEQLRLGKLGLSDCLAQIRKEAEREWTTTQVPHDRDNITHLSSRAQAEAALVKACGSETEQCAVILVVDRMQLYNERYGWEVGDKVLRFFADFIKGAFKVDDKAYRWTGPSVLLLLPGNVAKVNDEVRRVMEPRLQYEVEISWRTVLLPIGTKWTILPLTVDPRLLVNRIDAFVSP